MQCWDYYGCITCCLFMRSKEMAGWPAGWVPAGRCGCWCWPGGWWCVPTGTTQTYKYVKRESKHLTASSKSVYMYMVGPSTEYNGIQYCIPCLCGWSFLLCLSYCVQCTCFDTQCRIHSHAVNLCAGNFNWCLGRSLSRSRHCELAHSILLKQSVKVLLSNDASGAQQAKPKPGVLFNLLRNCAVGDWRNTRNTTIHSKTSVVFCAAWVITQRVTVVHKRGPCPSAASMVSNQGDSWQQIRKARSGANGRIPSVCHPCSGSVRGRVDQDINKRTGSRRGDSGCLGQEGASQSVAIHSSLPGTVNKAFWVSLARSHRLRAEEDHGLLVPRTIYASTHPPCHELCPFRRIHDA